MASEEKEQGEEEKSALVASINYVAYANLAMVIVAVGIVGNVLNLVVLSRPKLKGVMYVYLLGLAVSNLCVLLTAIPALLDIAGEIQSHSYATAFFQAHLELPLLNSFMASSVYIIICMTVNRYISIYRPTHFQRIHTFHNAYIAIFLSFVGGAVLHVPLAFEAVVEPVDDVNDTLVFSPRPNRWIAEHVLFRVYLWVSEVLLRLGPIVALTILNALIIVRFRRIAMRREVLRGGVNAPQRCSPMPSMANMENNGEGEANAENAAKTSKLSFGAVVKVVKEGSNTLALPSPLQEPALVKAKPATLLVPDPTTTTGTSGFGGSSGLSRAASPCATSVAGSTRASPSRRSTSHRGSNRRRGVHSPEERMLVVVLIAIVLLFLVCTTPAAFLSILVTDELKREVSFTLFRACANNLELLCFALNFFVYCLCSADIRRAFVDVLFENAMVKALRRRRRRQQAQAPDEQQGRNGIELVDEPGNKAADLDDGKKKNDLNNFSVAL